MKNYGSSSSFNSNSQLEFLLEVLQATTDYRDDPNIVYCLLEANVDKLNDDFAQLLLNWAKSTLEQVDSKQAQYIVAVIGNFSNRISSFLLGDRAVNREIAIVGCQITSQVFTRENSSQDWAKLQNNWGEAYFKRIRGDRGENLEIAIRYYFSALEVFTQKSSPWAWASVQNNLGNAYSERIMGKREKNLEIANHYYSEALKVRTQQTFPFDWADTQNNLGQVYRNRIYGEKAKNLETAIHCFLNSLKVHTREVSPLIWAQVQNNLGVVYLDRIRGQKAENLEVAIHSFSIALQIHTRDTTPLDWGQTQMNLGIAYSKRIRGQKAENLETAINYLFKSLEVCSQEAFPQRWADLQINLGFAYIYRIRGQKAENLENAIEFFSNALKVFTYQFSPLEWADVQGLLGSVYIYRIWGNRTENLNTAIWYFQNTLKVRTCDNSPQKWLEAQFNLGYTYQKSQQFFDAYVSYSKAIDTIELVRSEIMLSFAAQVDRERFADNYNQIYQCMVEICLELKYSSRIIEYVERSKTRNLVELILTHDRHTIFPAEVVDRLDRLRDEIASGQYELQNATAENPAVLAQRLQQLRQERNELQDRYLPIGSGFQFEPFRSTLSDRTAIVEFYMTTDKLLVFIITQQSPQPIVLSPDLVDLKKLETWANSYLKAYRSKKDRWQRRLTTRLNLLAKILHFDEIIEQIPPECDQLTLIPHRFLHLLPLHALPLAGNSSLFERFPGRVSYAPSCQLLQLAQTRKRPEFTHLFAVQNPTGDLSYTDIEVETIQNYFNTSNLLKQQLATKEVIDETSLNTVHCAHFSCHGYFNVSEPRQSALILADAQLSAASKEPDTENYLSLANGRVLDLNKCLTLDKIFTLSLDRCRLVTLSACETGLIDFRNTSDEYIGLSSGFLYAGTPSVVSSLWTVNDLSTAFLMIQFYKNLLNSDGRADVAIALNKAQLWLRGVTKEKLLQWISENKISLNPTLKNNLRRRLHKMSDSDRPFESPFYWAAFCAIGQ